eukprot:1162143-Pelagomonas_calceolata.AAC.15
MSSGCPISTAWLALDEKNVSVRQFDAKQDCQMCLQACLTLNMYIVSSSAYPSYQGVQARPPKRFFILPEDAYRGATQLTSFCSNRAWVVAAAQA